MTKLNKVFLGLIVFFALAGLSLAQAQNAEGPENLVQNVHSRQYIRDIYRQLGLTDDQKKQLASNKKQHRARMESARQAMKTAKVALRDELMKPQLDMSKVNALHDQIKALESNMEDIKLSSILTVRAILTPDQFTKFVALMHKYKQEHKE